MVPRSRRWLAGGAAALLAAVALLFWLGLRESGRAASDAAYAADAADVAEAGDDAAALPEAPAGFEAVGDVPGFVAPERQRLAPSEDRSTPAAARKPSAGEETTGSLSVEVVWKSDGAPAADVGLRLLQLDRPDPLFHATLGHSDAGGRWLVAGLQPGRVVVSSDRLEAQAGLVVAGEVLELAIELLPGVLVRGTVVDDEQRPVP
jgi:hypothetical protein